MSNLNLKEKEIEMTIDKLQSMYYTKTETIHPQNIYDLKEVQECLGDEWEVIDFRQPENEDNFVSVGWRYFIGVGNDGGHPDRGPRLIVKPKSKPITDWREWHETIPTSVQSNAYVLRVLQDLIDGNIFEVVNCGDSRAGDWICLNDRIWKTGCGHPNSIILRKL